MSIGFDNDCDNESDTNSDEVGCIQKKSMV